MSTTQKRQDFSITIRHNVGGGVLSPTIYGVSFQLEEAFRTLLRDIRGVADVRLLENSECPKLFVVTKTDDIDRDHMIVQRMIQIEDIKPGLELNYDIVPEENAHFIPDDARSIF